MFRGPHYSPLFPYTTLFRSLTLLPGVSFERGPVADRHEPSVLDYGQRDFVQPVVRSRAVVERSEEHTSELQSRQYLVCRLLLEKKKDKNNLQDYSITANDCN